MLENLSAALETESKPICPKCGGQMTKRFRRSDNAPFWGCNSFPRCRGTRNATAQPHAQAQPVKGEKKTVIWSNYQKAVFEFIKSGTGNAMVIAVAGSGKTTTIEHGLEYTNPGLKVVFLAFGKRIAQELRARVPEHVSASTVHSLMLKNINAFIHGRCNIKSDKMKGVIRELIEALTIVDPKRAQLLDENFSVVSNLAGLVKNTLGDMSDDNLAYLSDRYGIVTNGDQEEIFEFVRMTMQQSNALFERAKIIDFDDMIYLPVAMNMTCEQYDFLFVDECQDLNKAQIACILKSVKPNGRVIAVGDPAQSIFGFRGADTDAIENLKTALNATILPLSICYRCPKSHVALAKQIMPDIEPFEGKHDGTLDRISFAQMTDTVKPGDLVICRTNAPLVGPAFELIRQGIKAIILGRDIGNGLQALVNKTRKANTCNTLTQLLHSLAEYKDREVQKLLAAKKEGAALHLTDQIETLIALANGCELIEDLQNKINVVFDDQAQGVVFSSVHKAKGSEAERVFLLREDLIPHPMASQDWQKEQELNLKYVALTRSKSELYFVRGDEGIAGNSLMDRMKLQATSI